jgi:hypothetical protein
MAALNVGRQIRTYSGIRLRYLGEKDTEPVEN